MLKNSRYLMLLAGLLAACGQTPAPRTSKPDAQDAAKLMLLSGTTKREEAHGLARYSSGVYMVGNAGGNLYGQHQGGGLDAFVAKYDAAGNLLWGRQFGTSSFDSARAVGTDAQDNVYVAGTTTGNLAGSRGGYDAFIRKYTPDGAVAWTRQLGASGSDSINDLAVDANGNIYIQQYINSRYGTAKYDTHGNRLWTRHAGTSTCDGSIAVNESGDLYTASVVGDSTGATLCLNRMTANGGILWVQKIRYDPYYYGGKGFRGGAVAASGSHVYVVGANGPAGDNDSNMFVIHFDAANPGRPTWEHTNLGTWGWDSVNDVTADAGGVYIAGYHYSPYANTYYGFVTKLGPDGSWPWIRAVSGPSNTIYTGTYGFAVATRPAQGGSEVYTAGYSFEDLGAGHKGDGDIFLRRLDGTTGSTVWTK